MKRKSVADPVILRLPEFEFIPQQLQPESVFFTPDFFKI